MNRPGPDTARTLGSVEAEIANALVRFQKEQHGRGAGDVRARIVGEMVVVRCGGIFTPTEAHLSASDAGRRLIRSAREELYAIARPELEETLSRIVGQPVVRSYYDISVDAAEQVEVYVFGADLERRFARTA